VLSTDPIHPDRAVLDKAAESLGRGEVVVAPTETRYGLLVRADDQKYLEILYALKGREGTKATALLVRDLDDAGALGEMTPEALALAEHFLPGPLTLVLRARRSWQPPRVVDGKIGVRWSSSPVIRGLMAKTSAPLTATSANISGRADPESVEEIVSMFGDRISVYIDAGPLTGRTSTVVDCSTRKARILREGAVPRAEIERVLGDVDERREKV